MRDRLPFVFGIVILFDSKIHIVPQFIGALHNKFETTNLGIESSTPSAPGGWVNPSHTLVPTMETIHRLWPPCTEESTRFSKCVLRLIF